jgi:hypothetical protein
MEVKYDTHVTVSQLCGRSTTNQSNGGRNKSSKYLLGAICVLPASIVIWVGNFRDLALAYTLNNNFTKAKPIFR